MSDDTTVETALKDCVHFLKIEPHPFHAVQTGRKTFEIRRNARDFREGDLVHLQEYGAGQYTGREVAARIDYASVFRQQPGYCVFALLEVQP